MGGFAAMAIIILATVTIGTFSVVNNQAINDRVFDLRVPTVLTTTRTVNAVNSSLAALRGYMILGKDRFKTQRAEAWRDLREMEAALQKFSRNWTNPENVRRLESISQSLNLFESAQSEVENISQTIDETPATKILVQDAAPQAAVIVAEITRMINIEADQPATARRKALLGMMADVRGSMGMSLANIRAYLLTGDAKFKQQFDSFWATNERRFNDLNRSSELLNREQRSAFDKLKTARGEFAPMPPRMFEIRGSDKWNMANYILGTKAAPEAGKILGLLKAMEQNQQALADTDITQAKADSKNLISQLIVLGVIAVSIAIGVAVVITRMVTNPVAQAAEGLKAITSGDLTQRFNSKSQDELGDMVRDLDSMSVSLMEIVANILENSEAVTAGAQQISNGNMDLSQRTEEQASSLEETASSIEEMTSTVKQNAESALQANKVANEARDQAEKGGKVVGRAVEAMSEINAASAEISDIITTIDSIAFQTNLLALNAAVEAARAGEQGRGFAVVASEVRTLAQRSAEAAKEIKVLIENSVQKVKAGTELVDESGKMLGNIVGSIKEVAELVNEIDAASREQSSGIDQINQAVAQMDDMTQQNAALVEESAAASRSMQEQAVTMSQAMTFFKVNDFGRQGHQQRAVPFSPASASAKHQPASQSHHSVAQKTAQAAVPRSGPTAKENPGNSATVTGNGDEQGWEEF